MVGVKLYFRDSFERVKHVKTCHRWSPILFNVFLRDRSQSKKQSRPQNAIFIKEAELICPDRDQIRACFLIGRLTARTPGGFLGDRNIPTGVWVTQVHAVVKAGGTDRTLETCATHGVQIIP